MSHQDDARHQISALLDELAAARVRLKEVRRAHEIVSDSAFAKFSSLATAFAQFRDRRLEQRGVRLNNHPAEAALQSSDSECFQALSLLDDAHATNQKDLRTLLAVVPFPLDASDGDDAIAVANAFVQSSMAEFVTFSPETNVKLELLAQTARLLNRRSDVDVLFFGTERSWCPDLILAVDFIGRSPIVRRSLFDSVGGFRKGSGRLAVYDLMLRLSAISNRFASLGAASPLWQADERGDPDLLEERKRIVKEFLSQRGDDAEITIATASRSLHVRRKPLTGLKTSVILTTFGCSDQLKRTLNSLQAHDSAYDYEILLVHIGRHSKKSSDAVQQLATDARIRFIRYNMEASYADARNYAASEADGQYYLFIDERDEFADVNFIEAFLEEIRRPEIGAVGISTGSERPLGTRSRARFVRPCIMVRKSDYQRIGGFDEAFLTSMAADDLCLSIQSLGLRNVETPHVKLTSTSDNDQLPSNNDDEERLERDREIFATKWGTALE